MPTILYIYGWRLFFYSNEKNEPIHIHVQKANMEGKFWLKIDEISIEEAFCHNFTPAAKRFSTQICKSGFPCINTKHFGV